MMDILKSIDIYGEININDLFGLLKTKSQKSNSEIFDKIKNFNSFPDFCNYYLNQDSLKYFGNLQKIIYDFSKVDYTTSIIGTVERYISCTTKVLLSLSLLLKIQDALNKILTSTKKELKSLKIKNQIENLYQENLFYMIDFFPNISHADLSRNSSTSTTITNESSLDLSSHNLIFNKYPSQKEIEKFRFEINPEIYESAPKTPKFESDLNSITEEEIENLNENNKINIPDSALTLSEFIFDDGQNNNILEKEEKKIQKDKSYFQNVLLMIKNLYRKALINAEEKIKLKKKVINKSIKIEKFYYDIYRNSNIDKEKLIREIKKLME